MSEDETREAAEAAEAAEELEKRDANEEARELTPEEQQRLEEIREKRREALASQGRVDSGNTEGAVVDEASFAELTSILASLQQGLLHLTGILSADTKALNMVCDGLTGVPLVGVRNR